MSDDDRLTDYLARLADSGYTRTLADGCAGCGATVLTCNAERYLASARCCDSCGHTP